MQPKVCENTGGGISGCIAHPNTRPIAPPLPHSRGGGVATRRMPPEGFRGGGGRSVAAALPHRPPAAPEGKSLFRTAFGVDSVRPRIRPDRTSPYPWYGGTKGVTPSPRCRGCVLDPFGSVSPFDCNSLLRCIGVVGFRRCLWPESTGTCGKPRGVSQPS